MLKTNKSITITGTSEIDGKQVVYMSATISTDGNSSDNLVKNITNKELYNNNKVQVRKDIEDFSQAVYSAEDKMNNTEVQA